MESWDLAIIGSGTAALRAAIAAADAGTVPIILDGAGVGSASGSPALAGLAVSLDEVSSIGHREDTIAAGGELCDKVAAARTCGAAVDTLAQLERWGLVLRRREGGLPHVSQTPDHSVPRMTGCGDATVRNITRLLEEQTMKRGISRRTDLVTMSLVMDNGQIRGLSALDINSGKIVGIQTKAIILATDGHQGIWSTPSNGAGEGASLAAAAGITLRGMANLPRHPLTIRGTNTHLSLDLLGSGGRVRNNAGDDVELSEVDVDNCILDLRNLNSDAEVWFSQTRRRIKDRTGLDINRDVVPITATIAATTGGAPIDEHGRVTIEEGNRWATGLYAAGRSANSGVHGVGLLSGNLLLDDLVGGQAAGTHAGEWVQNASFGGSSLVSEAQNAAQDRIEALQNGVGHSVGQTAATLISIMSNSVNGSRDESSLKAAKQALTNLSAAGIRVTDGTSVMNMELATALKLEGMLTLADSIIDA